MKQFNISSGFYIGQRAAHLMTGCAVFVSLSVYSCTVGGLTGLARQWVASCFLTTCALTHSHRTARPCPPQTHASRAPKLPGCAKE